jgi:exodeoxyribonuclease V beta subunit
LTEAAQVFRDMAKTDDAFLQQLKAEYPEGEPREQAAHRLALAAQAMDDAAVYTIDAWCQRMLREHAFDSGSLFEENLVGDEAALRLEAVQDYWRQQLYPMGTERVTHVLGVWRDVPALEQDMRALMAVPLDDAQPGTLAQVFGAAMAERDAQLQSLKQGWGEKADNLLGWIEAQLAVKKHGWNGTLLQVGRSQKWLEALKSWAQSEGDFKALKDAMGKGWNRFTPEGLLECRKDGDVVDLPPESQIYAQLLAGLEALPDPTQAARLHARTHVLQRMAELKRRSGLFGFADMLERLEVALAALKDYLMKRKGSIDALVEALKQFEGTLVFISHDVYFIRALAQKVVHVADGVLTHYPGDYDLYLHQVDQGGDWEEIVEEQVSDTAYAILRAKKEAIKINKAFNDGAPVNWRDLVNLVVPSGVTMNIQDPEMLRVQEEAKNTGAAV